MFRRISGLIAILFFAMLVQADPVSELIRNSGNAKDYPGAQVVACDNPGEDDMLRIAAICARYGKGVSQEAVTVTVSRGTEKRELTVKPADHQDIEAFIIK